MDRTPRDDDYAQGARPRRTVRQPSYLQDYDVSYNVPQSEPPFPEPPQHSIVFVEYDKECEDDRESWWQNEAAKPYSPVSDISAIGSKEPMSISAHKGEMQTHSGVDLQIIQRLAEEIQQLKLELRQRYRHENVGENNQANVPELDTIEKSPLPLPRTIRSSMSATLPGAPVPAPRTPRHSPAPRPSSPPRPSLSSPQPAPRPSPPPRPSLSSPQPAPRPSPPLRPSLSSPQPAPRLYTLSAALPQVHKPYSAVADDTIEARQVTFQSSRSNYAHQSQQTQAQTTLEAASSAYAKSDALSHNSYLVPPVLPVSATNDQLGDRLVYGHSAMHHLPKSFTYNHYQPEPVPAYTSAYSQAASCKQTPSHTHMGYYRPEKPVLVQQMVYRGPKPTIPNFSNNDPSQFARLKIALENLLPADSTELFSYQILVDHLKLEEARLVADSYINSPTPFSDTMAALNERYGKPHQLALRKIATVMDLPDVRRGDTSAFERFSLQINALVGMLKTLGLEGEAELRCGSNVARLLTKLPPDMRANFRRHMYKPSGAMHTLSDLAAWLQYECHCQGYDGLSRRAEIDVAREKGDYKTKNPSKRTATILHGAEVTDNAIKPVHGQSYKSERKSKPNPYCPYCESSEHFLSQCSTFMTFTKEQKCDWLKINKRCWRCGRAHQAAQCTLKKPCSICQRKHLQILHNVNDRVKNEGSCLVSSASDILYLNRPAEGSKVLLKVIRVILSHGKKRLDTFAVLDDGSERTMLLPAAVHQLGLQSHPEVLSLRTIRQDVQVLNGAAVSFQKRFRIHNAFTAAQLGLAQHSYPVTTLQEKYIHLRGLPLQSFQNARPLLLIGADHPHLITPIEPVRLGPPGGPAAVKTRLGWTLQGPAKVFELKSHSQDCLFTSTSPETAELLRNVEKLWEMDTLPFRNERLITRSKEDHEAIHLLESRTIRTEIDGVYRYATPLLRRKNMPLFQAPKEAVLPLLRATERRLARKSEQAAVYRTEMSKLVDAGYVKRLPPDEVRSEGESWYLPHHLVQHNGKYRVVFNCSFQHRGLNVNKALMPGPQLSPSLLGVLLRFREHAVAVSGDIRSMFHQIRLLPEDKPIMRFIWRDLKGEQIPDTYEWQVLPFGTTCSPCCANYALQKHILDHSNLETNIRSTVMRCFYVDNLMQSMSSPVEAKKLVDELRRALSSGGFDIRQWASNVATVVSHLPSEARSDSAELWLSQDKTDTLEPALGLRWHCASDTLKYQLRTLDCVEPTMRNIYKTLASQYDPLGFLIPFTTRAKVLVQQLWAKPRQWDDPLLPETLLHAWLRWEEELKHLSEISIPRCYTTQSLVKSDLSRSLHIFCDASERAYGSVAYLRSETGMSR